MWKPIPEFDNYLINKKGDIKSLYHNIILKPSKHTNGYRFVCLYKNGKSYRRYIHRLVGLTFLKRPNEFYEINHKDGDKTNNNVNNLEWVTKSENHIHRIYNLQKFTNHQPKKVKCVETGKIYPSISVAARKNNLKNPVSVYEAVIGRKHTAAGYHWCYID